MERRSERETLVALLAAIADPAAAASLPPDDATVLAVARHHRLSPLLAATCGSRLRPALAESCRRDRSITLARNMLLSDAAQECLLALADAGLSAVLLKGLAYEKELYGQAGCRPTSDIDVLVPGDQRRVAFDVMAGLGFEPKAAAPGFDDADYHEVAWTRGHIAVDLHLALAPLARCVIDYDTVWADIRPTTLGKAPAFLLAPPHAAVFHALHMAIDHFDVPALYLLDFARLLPTVTAGGTADATARAWRCHRAFMTALSLTAAFVPSWAAPQSPARQSPRTARVVAGFGDTAPLPRVEQLRRKLAHIDTTGDAVRYLAVQTRRNLRELFERHVRKRSAQQRLNLARPAAAATMDVRSKQR